MPGITPLKIGGVALGSPVILAPMAGITDFPFRKIVSDFGAGLVISEMVASRAVIESLKNPIVRKRLYCFDNQKEKLPVAIQLVGYDPFIMAEAAKFQEELGASIIDINMGCPVKKVVNTDSGAALMKNEKLVADIVKHVVKAVKIPVTVKMRLGWDSNNLNAKKIAKIVEEEGGSAVAIHARTRAQFYSGEANWEAIKSIKECVNIPVIGNGDVKTPEDAVKMLSISKADGVMIGRGACGAPWVLSHIAEYLQTGQVGKKISHKEIYNTIKYHIELIMETYGEVKGPLLARKHLGWYCKGLPNSAEFRLAVNSTRDYEFLKNLIDVFFLT